MGNLWDLFNRLEKSEYCRYTKDGKYYIEEENKIITLKPQELLEIGRTYPSREQVMIAYFDDDLPTRVLYFGENANMMQKTLDKLKLPKSWPSNLGEKVFYLFKGHLEFINSGPVSLEQQVVSGIEHKFESIIKKLIDIYRTSEQKVFQGEKGDLSGVIFN
ncbi:MAG: hypothetical protein WC755_00645 [Candidatus Woesearchaeota archaeon]|jgi:hypothetical protein